MNESLHKRNKPKRHFQIVLILLSLFIFSSVLFAHSWMAPKEAAQKKNPIPMNPASIQNGKGIFLQSCAYCHGEKAGGRDSQTAGLKKDTPDLVQRLIDHTDGDFHWKIKNGRGEMPAFNEELSDDDIWDVINFIKSLE